MIELPSLKIMIIALLVAYGITWLICRYLLKLDRYKEDLDRLSNALLVFFLFNRLVFLIGHFSLVISSPLSLIQGRAGLWGFLLALPMGVLWYFFPKKQKNPSSFWPPLILLIILVVPLGLYQLQGPGDTHGNIGVEPGNIAPNVRIKAGVNLQDLRGDWVLLNFWATWCPPCKAEMPDLQRFFDLPQTKPEFYAVNLTSTETSLGQVQQFLDDQGYSFPIIFDESGSLADTFEIKQIPTTVLINPMGIIEDRREEVVSFTYLKSLLEK
jgi:thiol-disulfide isomerase/thioredoxin